MPTFKFGNTNIEYAISYSSTRKDITIAVDWADGVILIVPQETDQTEIDIAIQKKPLGYLINLQISEKLRCYRPIVNL